MRKKVKNYEIVYIYGLVDPRNNNVRYVGFTVNLKRRLTEHLSPSQMKVVSHKNRWIKQLLSIGLRPIITVLESVCPENYAEKEQEWIKFFGRGNLTNETDGGEGMINPSDETRKKLSEASSGEKNGNYGRHHTEDARKRMSDSRTGTHLSKKTKDKISKNSKHLKNNLGKSASLETRDKLSKAHLGIKNNLGKKWSLDTKRKHMYDRSGRKSKKNTKSKYVGLVYNKKLNKWESWITYCGIRYYLGIFKYEIEAALCYNNAAMEFYGWHAKLNQISQEEIDILWEEE